MRLEYYTANPCPFNDNLVLGTHLGEVLIVRRMGNKHKKKEIRREER